MAFHARKRLGQPFYNKRLGHPFYSGLDNRFTLGQIPVKLNGVIFISSDLMDSETLRDWMKLPIVVSSIRSLVRVNPLSAS